MKLSLCVGFIMFHRNRAALFSIPFLAVCHVRAVLGIHVEGQVVRGDPVLFNCNISVGNLTQINWTKGKLIFSQRIVGNGSFSNFTSQIVTIDPCCLSNLSILNAQHEDTGLYKCVIIYTNGIITTATWNLTVLEKHKENTLSIQLWILIYLLAPVVGLFLCGVTAAVCYHRSLKVRSRSPEEDPVQVQSLPQSEAEVTEVAPSVGTDGGMNKKHRSQYMERLNSIYGSY